jgi:hypothetical protein
MFTKRYVVVAIYEPEEEDDEPYPSCTYYDYDELDKALKEFEEVRGWIETSQSKGSPTPPRANQPNRQPPCQ